MFHENISKVAFLISTGRTGTQTLAFHINKHYENVCALHEPRPSRNLRIASIKHLAGKRTTKQMRNILIKSRSKLFMGIKQRIYIESNPFLYGFLEVLDELFTNAMVVHIIRDPRTYIPSHLNHKGLAGLKGLAANYSYWMLKPDYVSRNPEKRWRSMSSQEKLAWCWNTINAFLNRGEQLFGSRYLRIRYEDLFTQDGTGILKLCDWLGLEHKDAMTREMLGKRMNQGKNNICNKWETWDSDQQKLVLYHCEQLMNMYGYKL